MTIFAVRMEVVRALRADPEWLAKAKQCGSIGELEQVFVEFGRVKGYAVVEVPLK